MELLRRALRETFTSPYTYIGALAVGGFSFLAKDARLGYLVPFVVPFLVQAFTRFVMLHERSRQPSGPMSTSPARKIHDDP